MRGLCRIRSRRNVAARDRKSTRPELQSLTNLVCRLLLQKKFNVIVALPLPDEQSRSELFEVHLPKKPRAPVINIQTLAAATHYFIFFFFFNVRATPDFSPFPLPAALRT